MQKVNIKELADKFSAGTCTEEELAILENWYLQWKPEDYDMDEARLDALMKSVWQELPVNSKPKTFKLSARIAAVSMNWKIAAAVAVIVFGVWFFIPPAVILNLFQDPNAIAMKNDIAPGKNTATLTLANGEVIGLSEGKTGVVIDASRLSYSDGTEIKPAMGGGLDTKYSILNTISTPRGGQYQVVLPDGTKVWLNADSKLSFPSQFSEKERKVMLEGEAYFVVVHNAKQPFRVESKGQVVEDIGTEFNIRAYTDEGSIQTTLLEGEAAVNGRVLKPSQQATLTAGSISVDLSEVNTEEATAWKQGYFRFNNAKITDIMQQLARWYNIDVVYEGKTTDEGLYGKISRYKNISEVLKMLEKTGLVRFKVEGRRVFVKN